MHIVRFENTYSPAQTSSSDEHFNAKSKNEKKKNSKKNINYSEKSIKNKEQQPAIIRLHRITYILIDTSIYV
jgi:hypothetical protein